MSSSDSNSYRELLLAWKEELFNHDLTPLNLNFIRNYSLKIEEIKSKDIKDQFFHEILLKRIDFLLTNLIEIRTNKIIDCFLSKKDINTSYLSKQELIFFDYIKNSNQILKNQSILFSPQMCDYLESNSNLFSTKEMNKNDNIENKILPPEASSSDDKTIVVVFLKDIEKFIYKNNQFFGPFKVGDVVEIPVELFTNILFPKNYVKEN